MVLERRKKNHFLEESLLIVLLRGRQELPRPRTVLYYWGASKHSVTREAETPPPNPLAMSTGHGPVVFLGASLSLGTCQAV